MKKFSSSILLLVERLGTSAASCCDHTVLEWISRDRAGGFQLVLQRGEPTRVVSESIRQQINWVLFTMARMEGASRNPNVYGQRPKGQGKRKGKG